MVEPLVSQPLEHWEADVLHRFRTHAVVAVLVLYNHYHSVVIGYNLPSTRATMAQGPTYITSGIQCRRIQREAVEGERRATGIEQKKPDRQHHLTVRLS